MDQPLTGYCTVPDSAMDRRGETAITPAEAFRRLDELMVVVEALCPVWPSRPPLVPRAPLKL